MRNRRARAHDHRSVEQLGYLGCLWQFEEFGGAHARTGRFCHRGSTSNQLAGNANLIDAQAQRRERGPGDDLRQRRRPEDGEL
jgi:hypothetical protein